MTFDPDDPRLTAFALGELDDLDRPAVEAMLAESPEARRFVAEVRETAAILAETLRREPSPGLSIVQRIDLDASIGRRQAGSPGPSAALRLPMRRSLTALAAMAAGLLLALGGYGVGRLSSPGLASARAPGLAASAPAPGARAPAAEFALLEEPDALLDEGVAPEAAPEARSELLAEPSVATAEPGQPALDLALPASAPSGPSAARAAPGATEDSGLPALASRSPSDRSPGEVNAGRSGAGMAEKALEAAPEAASRGMPAAPAAPGGSLARRKQAPAIEPQVGPEGMAGMGMGMGLRGMLDQAPGADRAAGGMGGGMGGMGLMFSREAGQSAEGLGLAPSSPEGPRSRAVRVESGNMVEVVNLADGVVASRIALPQEVEQVELDPTGAQLLATGADRSLSVYEVDSGTLLNAIRVERGPVPDARFGAGGEVILSNLGARGGGPGRVPGLGWRSPAAEPVAMLPVNPGRVLLEEVGHRLDAGRVPVDDGPVPVAWIVNVPPYPPPRPWGAGRVTIDTRVMPAPWEEGNRLVRIVLATRPPGSDLDDPVVPRPPVVAEGVVARVEFNPGRVASYRPIGFETRPSPASAIVGGRDWLRAGDLTTLLIEVEPIAEAVVAGAPIAERARSSRYLAVAPEARDELCSITLSYREPGREGRRTVEHPVLDAVGPIAEAPEDVRLASAIAWFGLALGGAVGDVPGALDGASRLVEGIDEDFLPETRRELLGLIGRARSLVQEDEEGPGNPPE